MNEQMTQGACDLLVVIFDQVQAAALGVYGGPVPTPNFARLAKRGAVFDQAYCASPLCIPARASLWTGLLPHAHGARCGGEGFEELRPGTPLLMNRLLDAQYHVGYEGVWEMNLASADDRRDAFAHFVQGGFPYADHLRMLVEQGGVEGAQVRPVRTVADDGRAIDWQFSVPVPAVWTEPIEAHQDMRLVHSIARFIERSPHDRPLAAFAAPGAAHPPLLVPPPYCDLFDPKDMSLPPSCRVMDDEPPIVRNGPGRQAVRNFTPQRWRRAIAAYYGYCAFADACLGVLLDTLDETGRADRTTVIVTSDHGELLGAHNQYQKELLYEESARIPLLIAGPDVTPGRRSQLVSHVDIAPTLLARFNLPAFPHVHGIDLRSILANPNAPGQEQAVLQFNGELRGGFYTRGIVRGGYKYIYHRDGYEELFDLGHDREEMYNLADHAAGSPIKAELRQALAESLRDTDDFILRDFETFIHAD